jgi:hypothetical protein
MSSGVYFLALGQGRSKTGGERKARTGRMTRFFTERSEADFTGEERQILRDVEKQLKPLPSRGERAELESGANAAYPL